MTNRKSVFTNVVFRDVEKPG